MEEPQNLTDPSRRDSDAEWIVFGAICFTGFGVMIVAHPSRH